MSEFVSPVPMPALDAVAPEVYREIYGMPMFMTVPVADLEASKDFWMRGLGFIDLFSIPGRLTHLRRWAFQDVLLVPGEQADAASAMSVSFACVVGQLEEITEACEKLRPGCTAGPAEMPWNSLELTVVTPENTRVVMTAARPIDPDGAQADALREVGFDIPRN
ncbi:VOC family protein [Actinomadura barringtoniae]|uniref:VOC family protein n=1 Tax=Actinomadura barringtoniae TaxID=1427535 RepID=A0A939T794_9ACTN|nr:VOC family protein [Actinomadura barringtoniae]MBO2452858.1 VOC family protein [Actinomadura barringtoniae]